MANDREILRTIWEGQIAICFIPDCNEMIGLQQPENFYLMVPRITYLPIVIDKVKKFFSRFITKDQKDSNVWFEYNGTPLKLHYPIGVLYDLLHTDENKVPWCITTHFSNFPEEVLINFSTKDILETHFLSCLKEADVLKHRGQVISTMQKKDHNQLWLGLINEKFDQFWAVNRRLMEPHGEETFKYIPIRIYEGDNIYLQKLITPLTQSGLKKTVKDLLAYFSSSDRKAHAVRTHGIILHGDTQLQWLAEHLSYPDNFLHIQIFYET